MTSCDYIKKLEDAAIAAQSMRALLAALVDMAEDESDELLPLLYHTNDFWKGEYKRLFP